MIVNTSGSSKGVLTFSTANAGVLSEAMRIDQNANIGVGSSSPRVIIDADCTFTAPVTSISNKLQPAEWRV